MYYNGGSVEIVNFDFWKTSSGITESIRSVFDTDPYISVYQSKNPFGIDMADWSCELRSVNAVPDWFTWGSTGKYPQKGDLCPQEFLIYRWQGQPNNVPSSGTGRGDFQISIEQSIPLSGIERARFAMGYSVATCNDITADILTSASDVNSTYNLYAGGDALNPVYTTSNAFRKTSGTLNRFNIAYFPMYNRLANHYNDTWETTSTWMNAAVCPCPQMALMFCDISFASQTTIDKQDAIIRAAKGVQCISNTFEDSQTAEYTEPYVYLILMCPTLWGTITPPDPEQTTPNYSDQIDSIQTGVGDININLESTNDRLDQIIEKLDDIYENMGVSVDIDTTDIENSISNAASSIVSGIRGLFIPSQTDLINFRLNLQNDFQTHFPAFFTADDKVRNLYGIFSQSVTARTSITVPLVSMSVSDVAQNRNASFSFGGYEVPLKPNQDRLGILYDSLAFIIDAVATLGLLNMLRSKLRKILSGGTES